MSVPRPPPPDDTPGFFTKDPVRLAWVIYGFIQAVIVVLLATDTITQRVAAIVSGIALAAYIAVSELYVRPATVPRGPLEELARENGDGNARRR